jgi:hypothetical protein
MPQITKKELEDYMNFLNTFKSDLETNLGFREINCKSKDSLRRFNAGLYTESSVLIRLNKKRNRIHVGNGKENGTSRPLESPIFYNEDNLNRILGDFKSKARKSDKDKYQVIKNALKYYRIIKSQNGDILSFLQKISHALIESIDDIKVYLY